MDDVSCHSPDLVKVGMNPLPWRVGIVIHFGLLGDDALATFAFAFRRKGVMA